MNDDLIIYYYYYYYFALNVTLRLILLDEDEIGLINEKSNDVGNILMIIWINSGVMT